MSAIVMVPYGHHQQVVNYGISHLCFGVGQIDLLKIYGGVVSLRGSNWELLKLHVLHVSVKNGANVHLRVFKVQMCFRHSLVHIKCKIVLFCNLLAQFFCRSFETTGEFLLILFCHDSISFVACMKFPQFIYIYIYKVQNCSVLQSSCSFLLSQLSNQP